MGISSQGSFQYQKKYVANALIIKIPPRRNISICGNGLLNIYPLYPRIGPRNKKSRIARSFMGLLGISSTL